MRQVCPSLASYFEMRSTAKELSGQVTLDELVLNGKPFREAQPPRSWYEVLGEPSRIVGPSAPAPVGHRNNQIHIFDNLGVYLIEHHFTYKISSIAFVLWPDEAPFPPKEAFRGKLLVGNVAIFPGMRETELVRNSIPLANAIGAVWNARGENIYISVDCKGRRRSTRRRSKTKYVVDVSVCLKDDPWDASYRSEVLAIQSAQN